MTGIIEYDHIINANHIIHVKLMRQVLIKVRIVTKPDIWQLAQGAFGRPVAFTDNAVICEAAFCKLTDSNQSSWTRNNLTTPALFEFRYFILQNIEMSS